MENKKLKQENLKLRNLLNKNEDEVITITSNSIYKHIREADEAMDRYTNKLIKENLKHAKQKQSKRKSA